VVQNVQQTSSDDMIRAASLAGGEGCGPRAISHPRRPLRGREGRRGAGDQQQTVVKDEWSKTPRNAPCPCGSGKKFKHVPRRRRLIGHRHA
jgi:preprotein translocase subunit SecA